MENFDTQNEFAETARLLAELQKQLISYKSALDNINGAASSTQRVAEEVAKLSAVFKELNRTHVQLLNGFENTRRVLLSTQQKAEQLRKDLDRLGQGFADNMTAKARGSGSDQRLERALVNYQKSIGQEVRQLKGFLLINIIMVLVMFLIFFVVRGCDSGNMAQTSLERPVEQQNNDPQEIFGDPAQDFSENETLDNSSNGGDTELKIITEVPAGGAKIQILNGCGVGGVAQRFKTFLEGKSFPVQNTENADHFNYSNTLIFVNGAYFDTAKKLAEDLGIDPSNISPESLRWNDYHVTIVLGQNYRTLRPYR